jgi:hypothetical protein
MFVQQLKIQCIRFNDRVSVGMKGVTQAWQSKHEKNIQWKKASGGCPRNKRGNQTCNAPSGISSLNKWKSHKSRCRTKYPFSILQEVGEVMSCETTTPQRCSHCTVSRLTFGHRLTSSVRSGLGHPHSGAGGDEKARIGTGNGGEAMFGVNANEG